MIGNKRHDRTLVAYSVIAGVSHCTPSCPPDNAPSRPRPIGTSLQPTQQLGKGYSDRAERADFARILSLDMGDKTCKLPFCFKSLFQMTWWSTRFHQQVMAAEAVALVLQQKENV
jgi:hypothetical protein